MEPKVIELDVREDLRNKLEPFQKIMEQVKLLEKENDQLILHATFKPTPLLTLLKTKGFSNKIEQRESDHWLVTFTKKKSKSPLFSLFSSKQDKRKEKENVKNIDNVHTDEEIGRSVEQDLQVEGTIYRLDNRGLEPPKPMMRTLHQLSKMKHGEKLIITNERIPVFLIDELKELGYEYSHTQISENHVDITIVKK